MKRLLDVTRTVACCAIFVSASLAGEKTPISVEDVYRFDSPTALVVAADGGRAVYCRRWVDPDSHNVRYSLWRVNGDKSQCEPIEPGEPDARQPMLSPDGKWVFFLSSRAFPDGSPAFDPVPPYSDPAGDIWMIPVDGGTAIPLSGLGKPYGRVFSDSFYGNIAFSPDGRRLVFVADDGKDPRTPEEIANNVQIVREDQGEGYEGYGTAQIWIADLEQAPTEKGANAVHRITQDDVWYGDPQWTADGASLIVHANRTADRESARYSINKNYDLWRISLADNSVTQLTTGPGPEVSPRLSPDGKKILCLSIPRKGSHFDVLNLMVVELESGSRSILFDHHGPQAESPPHLPPSFPLPADCWLTDSTFYYSAMDRTGTKQQVIDLSSGVNALSETSPTAHSERHAKQAEARRRLTPPGNTFLQDRQIAQSEVVRWRSFDGLEIEGVVTRPADEKHSKPYPMVVFPHGGPHSRATNGFSFNAQVFAAHGYLVFQPNFRGSAGYGQRFLEADRMDLGGGDMRDILTGIEHLIAEGLVDADRQFVYGVSYGGFMTSWLIGHTNQFKAAVPQNAVTDMNAMWGLSDLQSWTEWEFGGRPWEVPQAMREHSPMTYAASVTTPTLILHSANDRRCPLPMGKMFYRALKSAGVETQMVIYADEGHPIQQPRHQQDVLVRVLNWFAQHDPGAK